MPTFSDGGRLKLKECDTRLQLVFNELIKSFDCTIICGHRSEADQDKAFAEGRSKLQWPSSKHNSFPSLAVDAAPYPVDFEDVKRFYFFGGYVKGVAAKLGIGIRWGGDWNGDNLLKEKFQDLPHFELT